MESLVTGKYGQIKTETIGGGTRATNGDETFRIGLYTGGAGFGEPMEREPLGVERDLKAGLVSNWSARHIYRVEWDAKKQRVDLEATAALRHEARKERIARGVPFDEFEKEWLMRKPPADILSLYGTWPDAQPLGPAFRPCSRSANVCRRWRKAADAASAWSCRSPSRWRRASRRVRWMNSATTPLSSPTHSESASSDISA